MAVDSLRASTWYGRVLLWRLENCCSMKGSLKIVAMLFCCPGKDLLFDFPIHRLLNTSSEAFDTHLAAVEVQRDVLEGRDWLLLRLRALSALVHCMLGLLVEWIGWGRFSWHVAGVQSDSLHRIKEKEELQKTSCSSIFTTLLNHANMLTSIFSC